jgi:hypothetical protein
MLSLTKNMRGGYFGVLTAPNNRIIAMLGSVRNDLNALRLTFLANLDTTSASFQSWSFR